MPHDWVPASTTAGPTFDSGSICTQRHRLLSGRTSCGTFLAAAKLGFGQFFFPLLKPGGHSAIWQHVLTIAAR